MCVCVCVYVHVLVLYMNVLCVLMPLCVLRLNLMPDVLKRNRLICVKWLLETKKKALSAASQKNFRLYIDFSFFQYQT